MKANAHNFFVEWESRLGHQNHGLHIQFAGRGGDGVGFVPEIVAMHDCILPTLGELERHRAPEAPARDCHKCLNVHPCCNTKTTYTTYRAVNSTPKRRVISHLPENTNGASSTDAASMNHRSKARNS